MRYESVGPSIGQELKRNAIYSIILIVIGIIIYVAWAFRKVSRPVASWKYGMAGVIALFHDVIIVTGIFCVLGKFYGIEVNTPFVAALLTVFGYSIADTIVVFDRIRENLPKSHEGFEETINTSINQTLRRSINTSLTVMLTLLAVVLFGGVSIKYFALALLVGIFFGTYSSIFLASPLLVLFEKWKR
jgi:preprotein translocase subunit SecF